MLRRVHHESLPLLGVPAHLEQPVERGGLQRLDQLRELARDLDRLFALRSLERLRELHEEADHGLIVRGVALLVDRVREDEGAEQLFVVGIGAEHERRARERDPDQLRAGALVLVVGEPALLAHQLELVVRERRDVDVRPPHRLRGDRDLRLLALLDRGGVEEVGQLVAQHAGEDADRADALAMHALRELAHERVGGIGGDVVDDDLIAREGEGDRLDAIQDAVETTHALVHSGRQLRMPLRIDRVLLNGDCELDQEFRELLRNSGLARARRRGGGGVGHESEITARKRSTQRQMPEENATDTGGAGITISEWRAQRSKCGEEAKTICTRVR